MKTNNIQHTIHAQTGTADLIIEIRLNDECKNGHEDFSITGSMYAKGKPRTERNHLGGGCIHEEILKARPDLQIFVDLHLCDANGIPMHAISNMHYHIQNGFSSTPVTKTGFQQEYCNYYRITPEEFNRLREAESETHFYIIFTQTDILERWKQQALEAIQLLEQMTGQKFKSTATRSNLVKPEQIEINQELDKIRNGYYSPTAKEERRQGKVQAYIQKMIDDAKKDCGEILQELEIRIQLYKLGGNRFIENCIYYKHSREVHFNWRGTILHTEEIQKIKDNLKLPQGVKYK